MTSHGNHQTTPDGVQHPAAHLAGFEGILQVDGYSGYKGLLAGRPPSQIRLS